MLQPKKEKKQPAVKIHNKQKGSKLLNVVGNNKKQIRFLIVELFHLKVTDKRL